MNGTPVTEFSSDELKEQRRQQALRWLEHPTFSLRTGMLVVTWVAVCIMLFKASVVMGVIALAITAHWLLIAPIIGGRIRIKQKAQTAKEKLAGHKTTGKPVREVSRQLVERRAKAVQQKRTESEKQRRRTANSPEC